MLGKKNGLEPKPLFTWQAPITAISVPPGTTPDDSDIYVVWENYYYGSPYGCFKASCTCTVLYRNQPVRSGIIPG